MYIIFWKNLGIFMKMLIFSIYLYNLQSIVFILNDTFSYYVLPQSRIPGKMFFKKLLTFSKKIEIWRFL